MAILILLALPLFASGASALMPRTHKWAIEYIALAAVALEMSLALVIASTVLADGTFHAGLLFETDALSAFFMGLAATVGLAVAIHSIGHLREEVHKGIIGFRRVRQYFVLFHLFFFAMYVVTTTASPLIMWVAIEATTLATAFLISFYHKPSALEAGWKHLIINSVGLLLGFFGTLLFLNAATNAGAGGGFITWDTLRAVQGSLDPLLITLAFIFVLVGYGTKVGFVPLHTWLPDAHGKAPIPISSLLSGLLLNVALIAILRFRTITDSVLDPSFTQDLLILFGIVSLVVASLIIFVQKNYKRLLAYSSIEHMGVMALGFGVGGIGVIAALMHMLYHAFLKPLLFFAAGNIFLKYSSTKIASVRGALTLLPVSSAVFFAALLAISGVPPSGMFFTKLSILAAGMQNFPYLMFIALLALIVVFAGFVKHATNMLFGEAPDDIPKGEANRWTLVSLAFLSLVFVVLSIWIPAPLSELVADAAAIIQ